MSLHNFLLLHLRSFFQNSSSCFIGVSKHLTTIKEKQMKARGPRPRAFICFSVFAYPDETLTLVLEIVHESFLIQGPKFCGFLMVNILGHENKTWFFMVSNFMSF